MPDLALGSVSLQVELDLSRVKADVKAAMDAAGRSIDISSFSGLVDAAKGAEAGLKKLNIEVKQFEGNLTNIGSSGKSSFGVLTTLVGDAIGYYKQMNLSIGATAGAFKDAQKSGIAFLGNLQSEANSSAKAFTSIGTSASGLSAAFTGLDDPLKGVTTSLKAIAKLSLGDLAKETTKLATSLKAVETSANTVEQAWLRTKATFSSAANAMEGQARSTGAVLVENLNHQAADTVAAAWRRTRVVFNNATDNMVSNARSTGLAIVNSIGGAIDKLKREMSGGLGGMSFGSFSIATAGVDALKNAIGALKDFAIDAFRNMAGALVGFTAKALDTAASISKSLNVVKSLTGDQNTGALQSAIVAAGVASTQTTASIATYTEQLARSGMGQKDIALALKPIALLADASGEDIAKTGKAVIAAGNAYQLGSDKMGAISTTLLAAATSSQGASTAGFDKFNQYFKVQSASGEEGLKRSAQIYTLLKSAGAENAAAGRNIASFYKALANPSEKNQNAQTEINALLKARGLDGNVSGFDSSGKQRSEVESLLSAVKAYRQLKAEVGDQKAMGLFGSSMGVEAMRQIVAMANQSEEKIQKSLDTINRKIAQSGLVEAFYKQATSGLAGARKLLEGSLDGFTASYGLSLEGIASTATGVFAVAMAQIASDESLFEPFKELSKEMNDFAASPSFKVLGDGLAAIGKEMITLGANAAVDMFKEIASEFGSVTEGLDLMGIAIQVPVRGFLLMAGGLKNLVLLGIRFTRLYRDMKASIEGNPLTSMFGPSVTSGMTSFVDGFKKIGKAIRDTQLETGPATFTAMAVAFKILGDLFRTASPALAVIVRLLGKLAAVNMTILVVALRALNIVLSPVLFVLTKVLDLVDLVAAKALPKLNEGLGKATQFFSALGKQIGDASKMLLGFSGTELKKNPISLPGIATGAGDALKGAGSLAVEATEGLVSNNVNLMTGMITTLNNTFPQIGQAWQLMTSGLGQAWQLMTAGLTLLWEIAVARIGERLDVAKALLELGFTALGAAWSIVATGIKLSWDLVAIAIDASFTALGAAWSIVATAIGSAWTIITTGIQLAWDLLKIALELGFSVLQIAWSTVVSAMQPVWDSLMLAVKTAWDSFSSTIAFGIASIQAAWDAMCLVLATAFKAIAAGISDALNGILTAVGNVANGISSGIGNAANGLLATFSSVRSAIVSWMAPINDAIAGLGRAASAMGDYAKQAASSVSSFNPFAGLLPGFAQGGVIPGYSPVDDQLIMARSGEGILVPQAVNLLGGSIGIDRLNRSAEQGSLPRYATGGVVGSPNGPQGVSQIGTILQAIGSITKSFPELQKVIKALAVTVTPELLSQLGVAIGKLSSGAKAQINSVVKASVDALGAKSSGALGKVAQSLGSSAGDSLKTGAIAVAALKAGLSKAQTAYVLATAQHESDQFRTMAEYASGSDYEGRSDLGNTQAGDGTKYKGRGFVQLTGRANYTKYAQKLGIDLVNNPQLAEIPEIAIKILIEGMKSGTYTGRKLGDYNDGDFEGMRAIVNGSDKAGLIAGYARKYQSALTSMGGVVQSVSEKTLNDLTAIVNASKSSVGAIGGSTVDGLKAALAKIPVQYRGAIESVLSGASKTLPSQLAGWLSQLMPGLTSGPVGMTGNAAKIVATARSWVGKEFNPGVFAQCAAFVRSIFSQAGMGLSETLSRSADGQDYGVLEAGSLLKSSLGTIIKDKSKIMAGDIILWSKTYGDYGDDATHVGIATGNGMMIDRSTSSAPVRERSIDTFKNFMGAVRPGGQIDKDVSVNVQRLREGLTLAGSKLAQLGNVTIAGSTSVVSSLDEAIAALQKKKDGTNVGTDDRLDTRLAIEQKDRQDLTLKQAKDLQEFKRKALVKLKQAESDLALAKSVAAKQTAQTALDNLKISQPIALAKLIESQALKDRKAKESIDRAIASIANKTTKDGLNPDLQKLEQLKKLQADFATGTITESQLQSQLEALGIAVRSIGESAIDTTGKLNGLAKQQAALVPTMKSLFSIINEGLKTASDLARDFRGEGNQIARQLGRLDLSESQRINALPLAYRKMLEGRVPGNFSNRSNASGAGNSGTPQDINIQFNTRSMGGEAYVPLSQAQSAVTRAVGAATFSDVYRNSYTDRLASGFG